MNIQQFQYVLAVADSENFQSAAEKCFVTQSTLSTMIHKFEAEIGIKIFNRKTKPVSITKEGERIIDRLRIVVNEIELLKYSIQEEKGGMTGDLSIGIIPTIAPYLLPMIITEYAIRFPKINIRIKELTTTQIQKELITRNLDIGILALPLHHKELIEVPVYEEPFLIYDCSGSSDKGKVDPVDLDYSKICILEDGHCLKTQVYRICEFSKKKAVSDVNYTFESGSMESLIRITRSRKGFTILPLLACQALVLKEGEILRAFKSPVPVRRVGLLTHRFFAKKKLRTVLEEVIRESVEDLIPKSIPRQIVHPI